MTWLTSPSSPTTTLKLACDNGLTGGNLTLGALSQYVIGNIPTTTPASAPIVLPTASTSLLGLVKPDGVTLKISTDGTLSVMGEGLSALSPAPSLTGVEFLAVNTTSGDYKLSINTLKAFVGSSSGNTAIASSSSVGTVKPDGITLTVSTDGTLSAIVASVHTIPAGSGLSGNDEIAVYSLTGANDVKYTAANFANYAFQNVTSWATSGRPILAPGVCSIGYNSTLITLEYGVGQSNGSASWTSIGAGSSSTSQPSGTTGSGSGTGSGTGTGTTGSGSTANSYPTLTFTSPATYSTGKFGSGALSGGAATTSTFVLPSNNAPSGPSNQTSVSFGFWIKCAGAYNGNLSDFITFNNTGRSFGWAFGNGSDLQADTSGGHTSVNTAIRDGNWHYLLIAIASNYGYEYGQYYVDGVLVASPSGATYLTTDPSFIGLDLSHLAAGDLIDDLVVYNTFVDGKVVPTAPPVRDVTTVVIYDLDNSAVGR